MAELNFEAFRRRVEHSGSQSTRHQGFDFDSLTETCRWVTLQDSYCFENKEIRDSPGILKFFSLEPDVESLQHFPEDLLDEAFCPLHADTARRYRHENFHPEYAGAIVKWQGTPDDSFQLIRFGEGGDDLMHCVLAEEPVPASKPRVSFDETTRSIHLKSEDEFDSVPDVSSERDDREQGGKVDNEYEHEDVVEHKISQSNDAATILSDDETSQDERIMKIKKTQQRDAIFHKPVSVSDERVAALVKKDLRIGEKPGYVYAFRDRDADIVKVGSTKQIISRFGQIHSQCRPGEPLLIVVGDEKRPATFAFKRLERLIQAYLQPHRWFFKCVCGKSKNTRHQEWFRVPDNAIRDAFALWEKFLLERPYGDLVELKSYPLLTEWSGRIDGRALPSPDEKHEHHEEKLKRWKKSLHLFTPGAAHDDDASARAFEVEPPSTGSKITGFPAEFFTELAGQTSSNPPTQMSGVPESGLVLEPSLLTSVRLPTKARSAGSTPEPKQEKIQESNRIASGNTKAIFDFLPFGTQGQPSGFSPYGKQVGNFTFTVPGSSQSDNHENKSVAAERISQPGSMEPSTNVTYQAALPTGNQVDQLKRQARTEEDGNVSLGLDGNQDDVLDQFRRLLLSLQRNGLPEKIRNDIIRFRWPMGYALTLCLYSAYVPRILAFLTWIIFLPLFMAELRSWFPKEYYLDGTDNNS